jgi:hypothetical protein
MFTLIDFDSRDGLQPKNLKPLMTAPAPGTAAAPAATPPAKKE